MVELDNDMMLEIIKEKMTPELYSWMKRQFSNVCSNGDVCINNLLDDMNEVYCLKNKFVITAEPKYIDYIYDAYINLYCNNKDPNPWWAD